jgi:hypothetical protein
MLNKPITMKKITLFAILVFISLNTFSQTAFLKYEKDSSLSRILNNITNYKVFKTTELVISIFVVSNESGSANLPESDEVSEKVFVGVSEFDEYPKQMLYSVDNLYMPKDFKIVEKNADYIILTFSHGPKLKPSIVEIKITNEGLTKLKL